MFSETIRGWLGRVLVGSRANRIAVKPTIVASPDYSDGDLVGTLLTFTNAGEESGGGGIIQSAYLVDDAGQEIPMDLVLSNTNFPNSTLTDNAAVAVDEADAEDSEGVIRFATGNYADVGTPSIGSRAGLGHKFKCASGDANLYGILVARGTYNAAAVDDLTVILEIIPD